MKETLKVKKIHTDSQLPIQATPGSAGWDVFAYLNNRNITYYTEANIKYPNTKIGPEGVIRINPHCRALIPTGIILDIPDNYEVQLRARSGLALKQGITLANGIATIDSDYIEELGVIILNTSYNDIIISHGDRIAQLLLKRVEIFDLQEVQNIESKSNRKGGFGSTGL